MRQGRGGLPHSSTISIPSGRTFTAIFTSTSTTSVLGGRSTSPPSSQHAPAHAHLYCCGPLPMLEAFEKATASRPAGQVHVEYFQARQAPAIDGGFEVRLARSNRTIAVEPGKTILDAVLDAGVIGKLLLRGRSLRDLRNAGDRGNAGSSRPVPQPGRARLTNKTIMICCSGSRSGTLVLDL